LFLLIACVLSARLTPNSKLPSTFDDFVENSLGRVTHRLKGNYKADNFVSSTIPETGISQIAGLLTEKMAWVPSQSISQIMKSAQSINKGQISSHYIFFTTPKLGKFNYCLVNLVKKNDGSITVQVSHDSRRAFGIMKETHYHTMEISVLGLPSAGIQTLFSLNQGPNSEAFHKYNKKVLLESISQARATQIQVAPQSLGIPIAAVIMGAKMAIEAIASSWKAIVDAFKTITKEEIKEKITGEGFDEYTSKSRYIRSVGIPFSYWTTYKTNFMDLTGIAKNPLVKPEIETLLNMASFIADNAWNTNDMTFDVTKGGRCSNFVSMTRKDDVDQKFHMISTVVDGTFQLAPNIWVYSKYKSVAGGILETTKLETRRVPRSITEGDVKAVNAMMLLTSVSVMQENFGIPKTLPEFKEMMAVTK
jgi:hypothetical protein